MNDGLAVGSLDGRALFMDGRGNAIGEPVKVSASGEAINGVATFPKWLTASTRDEVNFWPVPDTPVGESLGFTFPHGAHMVIAAAAGYFIASLGQTGIMVAKPPFGVGMSGKVHNTRAEGLYIYRLTIVGTEDGKEVLACASRTGGITTMDLSGPDEMRSMNTVTFEGVDFIDICPLAVGTASRAAVGLGLDGAMVLFSDIIDDKSPIMLKFDMLEGVAYRILSCRGDLYLLTSKALYALNSIAARFMAGEEVATDTQIFTLSVGGVDINLVGEDSLAVTTASGVLVFDINAVRASDSQALSRSSYQIGEPSVIRSKGYWRPTKVSEESGEMVGAAR
jgi:hypothetical protein